MGKPWGPDESIWICCHSFQGAVVEARPAKETKDNDDSLLSLGLGKQSHGKI